VRRYVIIGSGVAGVAAAEAIRCQDPGGSLLMIGNEPEGYYSRPGLAFYLTGELNEKQLKPLPDQYFTKMGIQQLVGNVSRIHPNAHQVELEHGQRVQYDRLLIATGAAAAAPRLKGLQAEGVVKLDCLADARQILRQARKTRTAVVVGGGITALEIVEGLVAQRVQTHYFLRGDRYWSSVLDETESCLVLDRLREHGVKIHFHTELAEIIEQNGKLHGVRTADGRSLACDLLGYAIGVRPRMEIAQSSGIPCERGILVDETLQTERPDIYAAGDVAQVYDPFTGESVLDSLWGPAREQGSIAGLNMAGNRQPYYKPPPFNVTRLAGLTTTIIGTVGRGDDMDLAGIARGDSEVWRQLPDAIAAQAHFDINRLRVLVGQHCLIGAILIGDQTLSLPLQRLITERVDITPIREWMLKPAAPLADLLADYWTEYQAGVRFATH
jgi:3-phenylpropionate/trans-cinnamate dioxygenase ferredoxin reductase component